jgi:hypothetical protein
MIVKFATPQTRADVQQIVRLALIAAFNDMGDVMGQGDEISLDFYRDEGMGNVPDDLPDFHVILMSDDEYCKRSRDDKPTAKPAADDDDPIEFSVN